MFRFRCISFLGFITGIDPFIDTVFVGWALEVGCHGGGGAKTVVIPGVFYQYNPYTAVCFICKRKPLLGLYIHRQFSRIFVVFFYRTVKKKNVNLKVTQLLIR